MDARLKFARRCLYCACPWTHGMAHREHHGLALKFCDSEACAMKAYEYMLGSDFRRDWDPKLYHPVKVTQKYIDRHVEITSQMMVWR